MLRSWWADHHTTLLRLAVALMAVAALVWLGYQFWRLLWGSAPIWHSSPSGAVDLKNLHDVVQHWFAGRPVYSKLGYAVLPPATYAILWPFLGWLAVTPARWLWAATTVAALGWLVYLIVQESGTDTPLERVFVALMPISMYATGATIGNGQLIVHFLPMLVAGLLLLQQGQRGWHEDLWVAALILMALVKPSVSVPFFWIVLFVPGRLRPAMFVVSGYVALTLFAASFQEPGLWPLLQGWMLHGSEVTARQGYADLYIWLATLGLEEWILPVSLLVLAALGLWTYRHRYVDLWLLLGVTAFVARFWTYHRWYDDLLVLLPMVALFRIAKRGPSADGSDVVAGVLLALTLLTTLAPGGLYLFPLPWNRLYVTGQVFVWIVVLVFLLDRARHEKNTQVS
jgi:hypothetical protein